MTAPAEGDTRPVIYEEWSAEVDVIVVCVMRDRALIGRTESGCTVCSMTLPWVLLEAMLAVEYCLSTWQSWH